MRIRSVLVHLVKHRSASHEWRQKTSNVASNFLTRTFCDNVYSTLSRSYTIEISHYQGNIVILYRNSTNEAKNTIIGLKVSYPQNNYVGDIMLFFGQR